MLSTPRSQPTMTALVPSTKVWPAGFDSNCVPLASGRLESWSQPVYPTVTRLPLTARAPVPATRSFAEYGAVVVTTVGGGVAAAGGRGGHKNENTNQSDHRTLPQFAGRLII